MSEETIQRYLYDKLANTSVTIILITPEAINHRKNIYGKYDDWMYDEIRYSLEDRIGNRTNGLVAVYTPEAELLLLQKQKHICNVCRQESEVIYIKPCDNLFRANMTNVKPRYKKNKCAGIFDADADSYCSLVSLEDFENNYTLYIDQAAEKRNRLDEFEIRKRL